MGKDEECFDVGYYFEPVEGKAPVIKCPLRYASYPEDSDEYKVYSEMKKCADELGVEMVDKTDEWVIHIYDSTTTVGVTDAK